MKAITIKQPWASLIIKGVKYVENRTWKTNFRGRVLVHTAGKPAIKPRDISLIELYRIGMTDQMIREAIKAHYKEALYLNGHIIGSVEIVGCILNHPSIWAEKTDGITDCDTKEFIPRKSPKPIYNWILSNPIEFPEPIPAKGKLSFWEYPDINESTK